MPAYILVDIGVHDAGRYEEYKRLVPPSIAAYGGRYLVRGAPVEQLEGSWRPRRLVVLEFPTAERARAWWGSPEYAEAKALRQATADAHMILVEGVSSPAG